MPYAGGSFGVNAEFPEVCPDIPLFPFFAEYPRKCNQSTSVHFVPSQNACTRPTFLLLKNLSSVHCELSGWPRFKILELNVTEGMEISNRLFDVTLLEPVAGMYQINSLTPDPLGGGFLCSVESSAGGCAGHSPRYRHHVYFALRKSSDGRIYEAVPRGIIPEQNALGIVLFDQAVPLLVPVVRTESSPAGLRLTSNTFS